MRLPRREGSGRWALGDELQLSSVKGGYGVWGEAGGTAEARGLWWTSRQAEVRGLDSEGSRELWRTEVGHGQTCLEEQVLSVGGGTGSRRPARLF